MREHVEAGRAGGGRGAAADRCAAGSGAVPRRPRAEATRCMGRSPRAGQVRVRGARDRAAAERASTACERLCDMDALSDDDDFLRRDTQVPTLLTHGAAWTARSAAAVDTEDVEQQVVFPRVQGRPSSRLGECGPPGYLHHPPVKHTSSKNRLITMPVYNSVTATAPEISETTWLRFA